MHNIFGEGYLHAMPLMALAVDKLTGLSWSDFISKIAPGLLAIVLISGTLVKFYGDSKSAQIEQLIKVSNDGVRELIAARMETMRLELKLYVDSDRKGIFTSAMFRAEMAHRDNLMAEIARKQDEVREELISALRVDVERLKSSQTNLKLKIGSFQK